MTTYQIAADQLQSFIERVERLNEEISTIQADRKEVFAEAKGHGFDVKAMRAIIRLRALDDMDRQEQELILDTYRRAVGV